MTWENTNQTILETGNSPSCFKKGYKLNFTTSGWYLTPPLHQWNLKTNLTSNRKRTKVPKRWRHQGPCGKSSTRWTTSSLVKPKLKERTKLLISPSKLSTTTHTNHLFSPSQVYICAPVKVWPKDQPAEATLLDTMVRPSLVVTLKDRACPLR